MMRRRRRKTSNSGSGRCFETKLPVIPGAERKETAKRQRRNCPLNGRRKEGKDGIEGEIEACGKSS